MFICARAIHFAVTARPARKMRSSHHHHHRHHQEEEQQQQYYHGVEMFSPMATRPQRSPDGKRKSEM